MLTSFVKKEIKLIHVIENKKRFEYYSNIPGETETFSFEEDALLLIKSWEKFNGLNHPRYFLQPSNFDITEKTKKEIEKNNNFIKEVIDNPHKEKENRYTNYTVIPIAVDYFRKYFKDDVYLFLTDLDVIYFDSFIEDLEMAQTKIGNKLAITILPWERTSTNINGKFMFDTVFQLLKQGNIPENFKEHFHREKLNSCINTWFMYGHKDCVFFKEYKELTFWIHSQKDLIMDTQNLNDKIYNCFEDMVEELAASIIYCNYPEQFIDVREAFGNIIAFQENHSYDVKDIFSVTENTKIYHYNSLEFFSLSVDKLTDIKNLKSVTNMILELFGMKALFKAFNFSSIKELMRIK